MNESAERVALRSILSILGHAPSQMDAGSEVEWYAAVECAREALGVYRTLREEDIHYSGEPIDRGWWVHALHRPSGVSTDVSAYEADNSVVDERTRDRAHRIALMSLTNRVGEEIINRAHKNLTGSFVYGVLAGWAQLDDVCQ